MSAELIVICGPTASGKSAVAVELCRMMDGEVVSADSMQIYRHMNIGTAKPTLDEMRAIPHHLLDIADPAEAYSVERYREAALRAIRNIHSRGKIPIVCGGTGLYINALTRPMSFATQGDREIRRELEQIAIAEGGKARLHGMLQAADPESAERLHCNDVRRVIRALEVYRLTGKKLSERLKEDQMREGAYKGILFALDWPRTELYDRINARVDAMVESGLIEEVKNLRGQGISDQSTAMQGIGYKEVLKALDGEISMADAISLTKQRSRNYAKRQLTWFRHDDRTSWVRAEGRTAEEISREIFQKSPIMPRQ